VKVAYTMFVILLTLVAGVAGIGFGIVLSFTPLRAILTSCV